MENENLKEPEPQDTETSKRGKSPRNRLLDRVKQLDALAKNKELKLAKLADVQLEAASLERLLYNDARDDRNNELTAQVTAQREEIARLTQANAELKSNSRLGRLNGFNLNGFPMTAFQHYKNKSLRLNRC